MFVRRDGFGTRQPKQHISDAEFKRLIITCETEHKKLAAEIEKLLYEFHDDGKNPEIMAKGMSRMKTNIHLAVNDSDKTIADLMTDGCNMGVKSLNRYLNQYEAASEECKDITKRLINLEEKLTIDIRKFL